MIRYPLLRGISRYLSIECPTVTSTLGDSQAKTPGAGECVSGEWDYRFVYCVCKHWSNKYIHYIFSSVSINRCLLQIISFRGSCSVHYYGRLCLELGWRGGGTEVKLET